MNVFRLHIFLSFLFTLPFCIYSDELSGTITDQSDYSPVDGVVVWLENTNFIDTTEINSNYRKKLK
jgi:hypothetical protein